jgi:signal transduction histidine kinase
MQQLRSHSRTGSVRFQLFRLVLLVSVTAMTISMVGGAFLEWNKYREQISQALNTTAQAAGLAASAAIVFHDRSATPEALQILKAQKEIKSAAVYPLEGYRLAIYGDVTGLPDYANQLVEHFPGIHPFSDSTTLFQPILLDGNVIGHIYLRASLLEPRKAYLLQAFLSVVASLLGLLLAIGLGKHFIDRIVGPVIHLADTSRQVRASRNFSLRAPPPNADAPHDEITELVDSFNAMLAEIEQNEQDLRRYHEMLEDKVLERTQALYVANRELQAAKDSAETASQAKTRFLAAASHDLRQPIQAINLFKEALDRTALSAEQQHISNYLSQSIQSLGEQLNALLDITRLDAGVMVATPEIIDADALLNRIDAEFSPIAAAKSLHFRIHYPHSEMVLFTDRKLLQSLLGNLVGNAIKYTDTGQGGVLVAIRRRGDQAIIQVWDTGSGIAPEHNEAIFDEYFQVGNPERDKAKGLGLGLAIVKRIAKLLGTEVVCRSRLGRGSVFEFRLPLAVKPQ